MPRKPRILVTSAAGRTSAVAVRELLNMGFPVRAFVRRDDARAQRLRAAGAEVFVGNLFDYRDLRRALVDVQRAYHCPPFAPHLLHNATLFAFAAAEARLEVVALMSAWNPHPTHPSMLTREHWLANNLYHWMPSVDVIHVNPGLFAFNYLTALRPIVHLGMLWAPFGEGLNAPPSNEDIGRVAAHVLADPSRHIGRCYRPTGPQLLSPHDIADILSRVLGRRVTYRDTSTTLFAKAAIALGFPIFEISLARYFYEELRRGAFEIGAPTAHVEEVCGQRPEEFETIARRYIAEPGLIWPGLTAGTKLDAFRFLLRMMLVRAPDLDRWEREHYVPQLLAPQLAHESPEWKASADRKQLLLLQRAAP